MKKFTEFDDIYGSDLSEISQDGTLRWTFVSKKEDGSLVAQHEWVKCRDFLGDAVMSTAWNEAIPKIYGFEFDGEDNPIDRDKTRLIMRVSSEGEAKYLLENIEPLNKVFKETGKGLTTVEEIESSDPLLNARYFLAEGDSVWADHPASLSFYTLLLRVATTASAKGDFVSLSKDYDAQSCNDSSYLRPLNRAFGSIKGFIDLMGDLDLQPFKDSINASGESEYAHEYGGVQSLSNLILAHRSGDYEAIEHLEEDGSCWDYSDYEDPSIFQPNWEAAKRMLFKLGKQAKAA